MKARDKMAAIANSMEGQHYVHGAKGARPNQGGGARVRPEAVYLKKDTSTTSPAFLAAYVDVGRPSKDDPKKWISDVHVCGGLYAVVGRVVSDGDSHVKKYLSLQNPTDPGRCFTAAFLTPRRVLGSREPGHVLAWGECCDGWRHFDCIGLIEYAVDQVSTKKLGGEIWQWASPKNILGSARITDNNDILNGDLVSQESDGNYHHIGMIYIDGGTPWVCQAEETKRGVTTSTSYNPGSWERWRLPDSLLKPDGEVDDNYPSTGWEPCCNVPCKEVGTW